MAHFPLLQHVSIENYGLYPGPQANGRFDVDFRGGLTLVLGANGLGKTTLMTMLFRLLAGTHDLRLPEGEIGTASLEAHELNATEKRQFAARVHDGAQNASARLHFALGGRNFQVTRRLSNLSLLDFSIDGLDGAPEETTYQAIVTESAGVSSYADWILILRTLVFFFEDRRSLVWDTGAQRQLLRALLLTPEQAHGWMVQERSILELDSRLRNLQAALKREEKEHNKIVAKVHNAPGVRMALAAAEAHLERLQEQHDALGERIEVAEESRYRARLDAMRSQAGYDQALRELERAQLLAVEAHLPTAEQSIKFILTRLMSDESCLACGTHGVEAKHQAMRLALEAHRCVVCDSVLPPADAQVVDLGNERLEAMQLRVESLHVQAREQARLRDEINRAYDDASAELARCVDERDEADDKVRALMNQLPADERRVSEHQKRFEGIGAHIVDLRAKLQVERTQFAEAMDAYRFDIQKFADGIKQHFARAAGGFLFEESRLSWAPVRQSIGQAGGAERAEYPAFAVELSGSDFVGAQRRDSPNQVSESQREFIDLAFRMALIEVASPEHASTLAVDAPESSLDAVFVDRAADVLSAFARAGGGQNRLVITSNLGAGELVPELLRQAAPVGERMDRVVNLFDAGVPTAAMLRSRDAYDKYWRQLRHRLEEGGAGFVEADPVMLDPEDTPSKPADPGTLTAAGHADGA